MSNGEGLAYMETDVGVWGILPRNDSNLIWKEDKICLKYEVVDIL